jgi:hypothetical protein
VFEPSQAPPQAVPSLAQAARPPTGAPVTGEQVPALPGRLQAWHWSPQPELQQTPSTQLPLVHWVPAVQLMPSDFLGWQVPPPQ